jgi:ADP-ribosylglycohydrolase
MLSYKKKVQGCILLSSFLETIGFNNGFWEFNYGRKLDTLESATSMNFIIYNHYMMLGGIENLDMKSFSSSDDTILMLATAKAVMNGGGEENYIKYYLEYYNRLKEEIRMTGQMTLQSLEILRIKKNIEAISYNTSAGGNGCAIRTAPIGLKYYDDVEKLAMEALVASLATHNYPLGYLGGVVSALFTCFAIKNINPFKWVDTLLNMNSNQFFLNLIRKYYEKIGELPDNYSEIYSKINEYFIFWQKYKENRMSKMKFKSLPIFVNYIDKMKDLSLYNSVNFKRGGWGQLGGSGLDSVIIAYDNLLLSAVPDENMIIDLENENIKFDWKIFLHNNLFFFGDNDSVSAISASWYGAYCGIDSFPMKQIEKLEFYSELKEIIDKF